MPPRVRGRTRRATRAADHATRGGPSPADLAAERRPDVDDREREEDRVEAIEHATAPGHPAGTVLRPHAALEHRLGEVTSGADEAGDDADGDELARLEGQGEQGAQEKRHRHGSEDAANESFDGLLR